MTLIEIMVVLAIISLILGGIGVMAVKQWERARLKKAFNDTLQLHSNSELFEVQHNRCPKNVLELHAAGIVTRAARDPWGNEYEIRCGDAEELVVASAGPDGQMSTDDDITSNGPSPTEDTRTRGAAEQPAP